MTVVEEREARCDIPSAVESAKLTAMLVASQSESKMDALLSSVAAVYGSIQAVISLITSEKISGMEQLTDLPAVPGTNTATICFAALLTLKTLKPNSQGLFCDWGPHTIQAAIDDCEKVCGQRVEPHLNSALLRLLGGADIEKVKEKAAKKAAEIELKIRQGMN